MTTTSLWGDAGHAAASVARTGARIDVVTDRTVLALEPVDRFVADLAQHADVRVFTDVEGSVEHITDRSVDFTGSALVAIGGGSVIDAAKIARYVRAAGTSRLRTAQRCGLRALPEAAPPQRLVALPTTVGTGAEASSGAIVRVAGRPTLVRGIAMVPDEAWYCRSFLEELPTSQQLRGAVEVLFRLLAPALEAHGEERLPDLLPLAVDVLAAGEQLRSRTDVPDALATILSVGARTHGARAHRGLHPFGSRVWYVTNEATSALGVPKMEVLPALWLGVLHLARTGGLDWVPPTRSDAVRAGLGLDPGADLADVLADTFRRWGVPTRLDLGATTADELADTCLWRWGHGLPMLRRATREDVASLLATASAAPWSPLSRGDSASRAQGRR